MSNFLLTSKAMFPKCGPKFVASVWIICSKKFAKLKAKYLKISLINQFSNHDPAIENGKLYFLKSLKIHWNQWKRCLRKDFFDSWLYKNPLLTKLQWVWIWKKIDSKYVKLPSLVMRLNEVSASSCTKTYLKIQIVHTNKAAHVLSGERSWLG